ncbi:MAG: tetratricopeptide repeat protein [Saprospirales bacterium]|nr:tetratricopeptide repeat protein [Saprospirales bacterium]MBK8490064.1 tetratricopeptide repeat protein [Saprospirales bacterium]
MNNHQANQNARISALVSAYEAEIESGELRFREEEDLLDLLEYYVVEQLPDQALEIIEFGISCYPYSSEFFLRKARFYLDHGREELAMVALDEGEALFSDDVDFHLLRAEAFALLGLFEQAHDIIDHLKETTSEESLSDLFLTEAVVFEMEEQFERMFYALRAALLENPKNEEALHQMWVCVELAKKYRESITFHEAFLNENPYSKQGWYNLGQSYEYYGQYEEAIEAFEFAIAIDPTFEFAYRDCAELYFQLKQYEKALRNYLDVLNQFEPDQDLFLNIGQCYLEMGELGIAKAFFQKAQRLDSLNDEVYFFLGDCFFREQQYQKASRYYLKAIQIEDRREEYYRALAETYLLLGKPQKARWYFQEAVEIAPEASEYWIRYAQFLMESGDLEEALEVLLESEEHAVGAELLYCRITCLLAMGRRAEALYWLNEALDEDYNRHQSLFEWMPSLLMDPEIQAIITTFQPF